jgi:hypothetical protein
MSRAGQKINIFPKKEPDPLSKILKQILENHIVYKEIAHPALESLQKAVL